MISKLHLASFSPAGSTQTVMEHLGSVFDIPITQQHDLCCPNFSEQLLTGEDVLIVGVPVFAGRVPIAAIERLRRMQGNATPAVAVVVYGNRDYDDALQELASVLNEQGFAVIAAAAFIARHSLFPVVAADRPDASDIEKIRDFGRNCQARLNTFSAGAKYTLPIPFITPYKPHTVIGFKPFVYKDDCQGCGMCAEMCPVSAIDPAQPTETDVERCISCAACVHICPHAARSFSTQAFDAMQRQFAEKFAERREPDVFFA